MWVVRQDAWYRIQATGQIMDDLVPIALVMNSLLSEILAVLCVIHVQLFYKSLIAAIVDKYLYAWTEKAKESGKVFYRMIVSIPGAGILTS